MKFYSELTKEFYDTQEDCLEAEVVYEEKQQAQEKLKKEKECRKREVQEAFNVYLNLKNKYIKDYKELILYQENFPSIGDYIKFII